MLFYYLHGMIFHLNYFFKKDGVQIYITLFSMQCESGVELMILLNCYLNGICTWTREILIFRKAENLVKWRTKTLFYEHSKLVVIKMVLSKERFFTKEDDNKCMQINEGSLTRRNNFRKWVTAYWPHYSVFDRLSYRWCFEGINLCA